MAWLVLLLGLGLWVVAHGLKRLAPGMRDMLTERLGAGASRGAIALCIGAGVALMVVGYRGAPFVPLYWPPGWGVHVNNLAMFAAVALLGMGTSKGRMRSWLRHPMLTGVVVWALAHLLVAGHLAALILFGGLAAWAAGMMLLINRQQPAWDRPEPGPWTGDLRLLGIAAVLYAVIALIHAWIGVWPFPG